MLVVCVICLTALLGLFVVCVLFGFYCATLFTGLVFGFSLIACL